MTATGADKHDDFELQPSQHETQPQPQPEPELEPALEPSAPAEPIEGAVGAEFEPSEYTEIQPGEPAAGELPQDGPPPSDKVDFENLPEFVWQREMLRKVRNWALLVTGVILAIALFFFLFVGKKTEEALKPVIDPYPKDVLNPSRE